MDLSQAQGKHNSPRSDFKGPRGPISNVKKQRRINNNDYLYYGKPGHYAYNYNKKQSYLYTYVANTTLTLTTNL